MDIQGTQRLEFFCIKKYLSMYTVEFVGHRIHDFVRVLCIYDVICRQLEGHRMQQA